MDADIHIPFLPLVVEHEVNATEEKVRVDVEIYPPPSIHTPPPYNKAEHELKFSEERETR